MKEDLLKRFEARFDSECGECGDDMEEGDPIARTPDGYYICQGCIDDYMESL